jgi:hypothetical protein
MEQTLVDNTCTEAVNGVAPPRRRRRYRIIEAEIRPVIERYLHPPNIDIINNDIMTAGRLLHYLSRRVVDN